MEQIRAGSLLKDFFSDKSDIILPIIISVVAHGLIIYLIFSGSGQLSGHDSKIDIGKKLAMAEDFLTGQSNALMMRLSSRLSRIRSAPQEVDSMEWTMESMPVKIISAAKRADLDLAGIKIIKAKSNESEDTYDVVLRIYSSAGKVFDDILFASHMVGDGTLHSKFKTDKMLIYVKDKKSSGTALFSAYTRETRRFYLNRISPQEFLLSATVEEVKNW
jgi:HAMP domain-containing protein